MGESPVERMDRMLDDIYSVMPLLHRTLLRGEGQGFNPMSSDFKVLGILVRHGPLPTSRIGAWLGISKPNMTSVIDRLISEGLVDRKRSTKDRRIVEVSLTSKGKGYMQDRWKEARKATKEKISTLSDEERNRLYESLENLRIILTKLNEMKKQ